MDKILGMDEAGRGPVLGPMVIAGVELNKETISLLKKEGIKDSKELSISTIKERYKMIEELSSQIYVEIIEAQQINELMKYHNLNDIEFIFYSQIIKRSDANEVQIDAFSSNARSIFMRFKQLFPTKNFVVKHKADRDYIAVSAASIVAKYFREKEMDKIKKRYEKEGYENIGSGYPSDPRTISFLTKYYKENKKFPKETRLRWETLENIKAKEKQKRLF